MKLSILIATVIDRRDMFIPLFEEFQKQAAGLPVEVLYIEDNKEISIGRKRQKLLEMAKGDYVVYFDSDDLPREKYVHAILGAAKLRPDCIGFKIAMTTNGTNPQTCIHSLANKSWEFKNGVYLRSVSHFNPVKRKIACQVGFPDKRFGEDKDYSDGVTPLCQSEIFIDDFLFDYRYSTAERHNKKYGINP